MGEVRLPITDYVALKYHPFNMRSADPRPSIAKTDERLASALGFSDEELALNRTGLLSEAQAKSIRQVQAAFALWPLTVRCVWLVGLGTPLLGLWGCTLFADSIPLVVAGALPAVGGLFWLWMKSTLPRPTWELRSVEGDALAISEDLGMGSSCVTKISDVELSVAPAVQASFASDARYRAYYVAGYQNHLLSAEAIERASS